MSGTTDTSTPQQRVAFYTAVCGVGLASAAVATAVQNCPLLIDQCAAALLGFNAPATYAQCAAAVLQRLASIQTSIGNGYQTGPAV